MALLNYTTKISAQRSLGEVQGILGEAGAAEISIRYDSKTKRPSGIEFSIDTPFGLRWYTLPANAEPVLATLADQKARQRGSYRRAYIKDTTEQAERVAWRIIKDWIEAQLAIVQTGMVSFHQVMLPSTPPPGARLWGVGAIIED